MFRVRDLAITTTKHTTTGFRPANVRNVQLQVFGQRTYVTYHYSTLQVFGQLNEQAAVAEARAAEHEAQNATLETKAAG